MWEKDVGKECGKGMRVECGKSVDHSNSRKWRFIPSHGHACTNKTSWQMLKHAYNSRGASSDGPTKIAWSSKCECE